MPKVTDESDEYKINRFLTNLTHSMCPGVIHVLALLPCDGHWFVIMPRSDLPELPKVFLSEKSKKVHTANCETLVQLGSRSSPALCLFCQRPTISTFLNEHLLWFNFSEPYLHTLTSPFPRIIMVRGGHRRHIPEPVKKIFVTMSRQMSSKDISIRYIWHWCTPQTNTCLSCNGNRKGVSGFEPDIPGRLVSPAIWS